VQTTISKSCESQPVSLHDATGRLRLGKCYLRSFPHSSLSTSAPNSIAMSTVPQQDLFSSTQPQPVVSSVLTSVSSLPDILVFSSGPSVSTFDQPLVSPAICSTVGPADLPNMSSTATTEVPHFRAKLCFHDVSRSASPWRHRRPNHVILAPMLCADRTVPFHPVNSDCLVLFILCVIFFTAVFVHLRFYLLQRPLSVHDQLRHAPIHHSAFFLQRRFYASMLFLPLAFPTASRTPLCALLLLF